mmetsp:Transcript_926/g.3695  ORF Transcript_926/g.3695 Transcript_926/m.3695 type:complete len:244 (+) Transcript_926:290-1021(+)
MSVSITASTADGAADGTFTAGSRDANDPSSRGRWANRGFTTPVIIGSGGGSGVTLGGPPDDFRDFLDLPEGGGGGRRGGGGGAGTPARSSEPGFARSTPMRAKWRMCSSDAGLRLKIECRPRSAVISSGAPSTASGPRTASRRRRSTPVMVSMVPCACSKATNMSQNSFSAAALPSLSVPPSPAAAADASPAAAVARSKRTLALATSLQPTRKSAYCATYAGWEMNDLRPSSKTFLATLSFLS